VRFTVVKLDVHSLAPPQFEVVLSIR